MPLETVSYLHPDWRPCVPWGVPASTFCCQLWWRVTCKEIKLEWGWLEGNICISLSLSVNFWGLRTRKWYNAGLSVESHFLLFLLIYIYKYNQNKTTTKQKNILFLSSPTDFLGKSILFLLGWHQTVNMILKEMPNTILKILTLIKKNLNNLLRGQRAYCG